jgi:Rrf2 family transcriptional regulator, iron-sulfur cluster assembly transcription factor
MHLAATKGVKRSFDSGAVKMKLGRESAYAIEGLLALAAKPFGTPMLLRDIAAARDVPTSFLAKIFQKLARNDIVLSSRGAIRGYALARRAKEIKLKDILLATEGADLFDRCILWNDRCADTNPCPLHGQWKRTRRHIVDELMERTTLADLAREQVR